MNETFSEWLTNQPLQIAMVLLPEHKDIEFTISTNKQVTNTNEETITCNKCAKGSTTMDVLTTEVSFTIEDGIKLSTSSLTGFTETEQEVLMDLVNQGLILPEYKYTEEGDTLLQLKANGEYSTID